MPGERARQKQKRDERRTMKKSQETMRVGEEKYS
jgi:hypothetical protein